MLKNYLKKLTIATTQPTDFSKNANNFWANNLTLCLLAFFGLFGMTNAFGQTTSTFTTSGTWTAPAGVTSVTVQAWGGGGRGGNTTSNTQASGGGGGAFAQKIVTVTPGVTYNVTVGAGGNQTIADGGDSFFIDNTTVLAKGGTAAANNSTTGAAGGSSALSIGDFVFRGGNGGDRASGNSGAGGGGAGTTGNGGDAVTTTFGSGTAVGGGNGGASQTGNSNGIAGSIIGGGGSGAKGNNNAGGNGARGEVRITFTCPTNTPSAGSNQTLAACATTTTLSGSAVPAGMAGVWSVVSGPIPTFSNINSPTSNISGLPLNTTTVLRWTVTNGACGSANSDVTIITSAGPGCLSYCASSGGTIADGITGVNFNTINNLGTTVNTAYQDFTSISTTVFKGSSYNLNVYINTGGNFTNHQSVYIDWNGDGDFVDAGEFYSLGTATNVTNGLTSLSPLSITVPIGAVTGAVRMRIQSRFNAATTGPCQTGFDGEVEDYTINIIDPAPCVAPTAQPTALSLTPAGSTIAGGFTAASPAPNNYLVIVSTNATPPAAPVNGTTYAIGSTYQAGYTVVDNDTNTTFTASGLTPLTTYYFYVYSFNSLCTGGPLYLGTSPLTGSTTTTTADYCTPTIAAAFQTATNHHIRKVEFIGTLQDVVNTSTFPTVAPFGYTNFTGLPVKSIQAKGEGVNIYMESPNSGYIKAWVDWNQDGDFADAGETVYDAGGVSQASTTLGFIVPTGIPAGDYRVRLRISGRNISGSDAGFSWNSCSTDLAYFGETEDYILRVIENCAARITSITTGEVCGSGSVTLQATATAGTTEFRWYANQTGGTPLATTPTGVWNTPSISTTTVFWVTAFNGSCETLVRTKITAFVKTVPTLGFASSTNEICGENSIVSLTAAGDTEIVYLIDENFEGGLGTFSNAFNVSNPAINAQTAWQTQVGPYVPTGLTWYPAIASNFGPNRFAFVNSDQGGFSCPPAGSYCYYTVDNGLVSSSINSTGFTDLTLTLRLYFDRYYPDGNNPAAEFMTVDVSTNGGTTWTSVSGNMTGDVGYGTRFTDMTYNFTPYINQANLRIRVRYFSNTWANGAAVDDIQLFGTKPLNTAFQWSGVSLPDVYTDAATTIPYVAGTPAVTVYVKPTLAQLEMGSYTFTATATLTNGCNVSTDITIDNKSSIWKGTVNNDWNNPNNWTPAIVPTPNTCVIIPTAPSSSNIIGTNYNGFGKSLIVKTGGILNIHPSNSLTITETVTVDAGGTFNIENSGSLIQVDNVANTGIVTMRRNVNIRRLDYVYWSSPMSAFALNSVSPATTGYKWKWEPTLASTINNHGNWVAANETMVRGKGYIVRGPDAYTATLQNYTANFVGTPNNGTITMPVLRGTYNGANYNTGLSTTLATANDDNWNLLGNPYPSAISADAFLGANTNLAGFIKLWTHGTLPSAAISDPFYEDFMINYTVNDYITYNALGGTQFGFDGSIAAGQGFFALMNHTSASTSENVTFNNTMRSNAYRNDLFYRNSNVTNTLDKSRIWLNLISPTSLSSMTLIGYAPEATNELDRLFDAPAMDVKTNYELYSLSNTDKLCIQGRALPFDQNDEVPLGMTIATQGIHRIAISNLDGLFADVNQTIYLEDKLLNVIHDLRVAPYSFTTTTGKHDNRFVLRFTNETLGNDDFITTNGVKVYTNNTINVTASSNIKSVTVYDVLGRTLGTVRNVNNTDVSLNGIAKTQSALVVIVELENGVQTTQKVIF